MALVDRLPGGLEALNPELATSRTDARDPGERPVLWWRRGFGRTGSTPVLIE